MIKLHVFFLCFCVLSSFGALMVDSYRVSRTRVKKAHLGRLHSSQVLGLVKDSLMVS